MERLAIIGTGGHAKVVADAAERSGWKNIIFFDERWPQFQRCMIWPIVGNFNNLMDTLIDYDGVCVAIGDNQIRLKVFQMLATRNAPLVNIIHPSAVISAYAEIGIGTVILAGAVINSCAKIGHCGIINTSASVDHDCILGEAVHISCGAHLAGGVVVGDESLIGVGACIKPNIQVGKQVTVGAGAAVVKNIMDGLMVVGVPAEERGNI
jgi:sugar O-acyltransferase (sialic acid O-acetyltransferase NeuD family)